MEIRKVPVCETIGCALVPCVSERYKEEARGTWARFSVEDLQKNTFVVYIGSGLTLAAGALAYHFKSPLPQYILGCAALGFACLTARGCRELYKSAILFREVYQSNRLEFKSLKTKSGS